MRHAEKLVHLYPECNITVFYMDLQIIGKETRTLFKRLSDNVTLLQGVPGEILKDEKTQRLVITTEDEKGVARISRQFDLIVLSVGMVPPQDIENTLTMLGSNPNSWGFFNTDKAEPGKDVIVAGCAEGPKDILSSIQDGKIAALEVIEELGIQKKDQKPDVAVLGNGVQAGITAEKIASYGYQVHLFGPAAASDSITGVNMVDNARIITVQGTAGNFSIYYESGGEKKYLTCAAIIASAEPDRLSTGPAGLKNSCMGLDEFCSMAARSPDEINNDTAIVLDYSGPEFKEPARLALTAAIKAAEAGKNISIIANKMLVHGPSGQQIYDSARQAGVSFLRFKTQEDLKFEKNPKGVTIKIKEATLPSLELSLECECIVFPDPRISGSVFRHMADRLNQHLDCEGFLQGANIRHRLTGSPRKGIFFAGSGHDDIDMDDLDREIQAIAAALATGGFDQPNADTGVEINQKKCAQCLTCIRVCPHNAIVMNNKNRPQIVPDACCSCHLCVANCPAYAIDSKELTNDQIADRAEKGRVMLLACERSAALAAGNLSLPAHIELVKIPCACRISSDIILRLLLNGASKVIISGCHEDNCRSLEGSRTAGENVQKVLSIPGMDNSKVVWEPVAANESVKIEQIIAKA
jgi:heterodisulfide reductase subunit A